MGHFLNRIKNIFSSGDPAQRELEYRLNRGLIIGENTHIPFLFGLPCQKN